MRSTARRVVTGHDASGKSVFLSDGPAPHVLEKGTDVDFIELWCTNGAPTMVASTEPEPTSDKINGLIRVSPPPRGTRFRINVLHPGHVLKLPKREDGRARGMHRTRSIDYGIVLQGEIYLVLDDSETLLRSGDVVIQRGTDHAWENRSDKPVRMAFILVDGEWTDELRAKLPQQLDLRY